MTVFKNNLILQGGSNLRPQTDLISTLRSRICEIFVVPTLQLISGIYLLGSPLHLGTYKDNLGFVINYDS